MVDIYVVHAKKEYGWDYIYKPRAYHSKDKAIEMLLSHMEEELTKDELKVLGGRDRIVKDLNRPTRDNCGMVGDVSFVSGGKSFSVFISREPDGFDFNDGDVYQDAVELDLMEFRKKTCGDTGNHVDQAK